MAVWQCSSVAKLDRQRLVETMLRHHFKHMLKWWWDHQTDQRTEWKISFSRKCWPFLEIESHLLLLNNNFTRMWMLKRCLKSTQMFYHKATLFIKNVLGSLQELGYGDKGHWSWGVSTAVELTLLNHRWWVHILKGPELFSIVLISLSRASSVSSDMKFLT